MSSNSPLAKANLVDSDTARNATRLFPEGLTIERTTATIADTNPKRNRSVADMLARAELRDKAAALCDPFVREYGSCMRDRLFSHIWECRHQSNRVQECLRVYVNDDVSEKYIEVYMRIRDEHWYNLQRNRAMRERAEREAADAAKAAPSTSPSPAS